MEQKSSTTKKVSKGKTYEEGFNDAWNLAKKLAGDPKKGAYSNDEMLDIFGGVLIQTLFSDYPLDKIVERVNAYEAGRITVGETLILKETGDRCVVLSRTKASNTTYLIVYHDGSTAIKAEVTLRKDYKRTGKRINVSRFLKEIGED